MKIAFQMDPLEKLNLRTDTTWQLMQEAKNRGEVYYFEPQKLSWNNNKLLAQANILSSDENQEIDLSEMDVIFIRQDPPYDMAYLTTTYLLEKIADQVLIINHPKAIRDFPEKISILDYPELIPPTLITYNYQEAKIFAKNFSQVIIKPLYSFAGNNIFCLSYDDLNFGNVISNLIQIYQAPVIIQKFIPEVKYGDKRIILIDGEPIGCYNRLPQNNDIRANVARGGEAFISELSERDKLICQAIKPKLVKNNLFFVGIDVIDGFLTEINITSPTGIVMIAEFCDSNIVKEIWDKIELKIRSY